tara:strand:+ start:788 stop:1096 length:309 start_codon:yes stop_codon:yes gene_type:complete
MKNKLHIQIVSQIAKDLNIEEKEVQRILTRFFGRSGMKKALSNYLMVDLKEFGQFWISYFSIWKKLNKIKKHNRNRTKYKRTYRLKNNEKRKHDRSNSNESV